MTEDETKAIFLLAGIPIINIYEIKNGYWPDHPDYDEIRRQNPWWLVLTEYGMIKIGWRKRVIEISWHDVDAKFYFVVTEDDVWKNEKHVHAYSYSKAVEYLRNFRINALKFA